MNWTSRDNFNFSSCSSIENPLIATIHPEFCENLSTFVIQSPPPSWGLIDPSLSESNPIIILKTRLKLESWLWKNWRYLFVERCSHRVSICSGNEITIGRLPSRERVLSSNSASWNANSWYRRHNRFQILDSPGRQGTCWRNWFARDQIRGSYLSFFLFLLVRKQDV